MKQTEKAISELQHITGLTDELEEPPAILESNLKEVLRVKAETRTSLPERSSDVSATDAARLPAWFPPWASRLSELYFSGTTSMFVLHGNTHDLIRIGADDEAPLRRACPSFWPSSSSAAGTLVLHYDLARGLRAFAGRDGERLKEMVPLANQKVGDLANSPQGPRHGPSHARSIRQQQHHGRRRRPVECRRRSDHASYIVPRGEPGHLSFDRIDASRDSSQLGHEPSCQTVEHGLRARGRKALRPQ